MWVTSLPRQGRDPVEPYPAGRGNRHVGLALQHTSAKGLPNSGMQGGDRIPPGPDLRLWDHKAAQLQHHKCDDDPAQGQLLMPSQKAGTHPLRVGEAVLGADR